MVDSMKKLWILLIVGLVLRCGLATVWIGYEPDVQTFKAWAQLAYTEGLPHLYETDVFLDYPPGYMYVLYILAAIQDLFGLDWNGSAMLILIKLPAMLADVLTGYLIYRIANKYMSALPALGLAALYVFNPAVLINSSVWGQVDSVFMLAIAGYLLLLQRGRLPLAAAVLGVAILLKPQGLLFGPFLLLAVIRAQDWRIFGKTVGSGIITVFALLLPFGILGNGVSWLLELYFTTLASYPYASLNAFNFMTLLGGNFVQLDGNPISYGAWGMMFMLAAFVYCLYLYCKSMNRKGAAFYLAFLFLAAVFMFMVKMHERYLFYALLPLLMSYIYVRDRRILGLFALFSITHFVNVAYVLRSLWRDQPFIPQWDPLLLVISGLHVIFLAYGAWLGWRLFGVSERLEPARAPVADQKANQTDALTAASRGRFFTSRDWLLSLGLTVVYAVFALVNLGAHQAPETFWKPAAKGESLIFDLGRTVHLDRLHTYAGVGHGKYTYSFSVDEQTWEQPTEINSDHTKVFTWNVITPEVEARYVKFEVIEKGFTIHEIAFFGDGSDQPLQVQLSSSENLSADDQGKPYHVIDEQQIVPYSPTFMNGTYFDEIYHARTAYEHLHQIEPYESTHPPLGKVFIAAGIALFGMNPFGWRIVGTLFGIAMVPIMYAFGKRLLGKSRYGFIASFLFTFDFMHFAQTRIATIDVYGVFFIILMFYFMYRYATLNFYQVGLRKTLIPLGLAGLFFGIGAASKWIVIYGGAGLAVILLMVLIERYQEHRRARLRLAEHAKATEELADLAEQEPSVLAELSQQEPYELAELSQQELSELAEVSEQTPSELAKPATQGSSDMEHTLETPIRQPLSDEEYSLLEKISRSYWKPTLLTLSWCILFFVIIPVAIYVMSYIPFMMVPGDGHGLKDVVSYQKHMFNYHSKLEATHPFGSPWYEWPLMITPIWYYSGKFLPEGMLSSIVSFGNPLVWWGGLVALLASVFTVFKRKHRPLLIVLIGFASQYLPWVGVPRLTFIYHYFAMVPFLALMLAYFIGKWTEQSKERRWLAWGYLAAVFLLFLMFYPILSGMVINAGYSASWLRWLPTWNFF